MIRGMLIRVNPCKYMTAYSKLWQPWEYALELQTGGLRRNTIPLEPGMICLVLGKEKYNEDTYYRILVGDQVCYMHDSLYNQINFQIVRSEAE